MPRRAHIIGSVQGSRGAEERGAEKGDVLRLKALSATTRVEIMVSEIDDETWIRIDVTDLRKTDFGRTVYHGPVHDMPTAEGVGR